MLKPMWIWSVFVLTISFHITIHSHQAAYQTGSFWANPATREEAQDFFELHGIKPRRRSEQERNPATREEAQDFFELHDIKPRRRSEQGAINGTQANPQATEENGNHAAMPVEKDQSEIPETKPKNKKAKKNDKKKKKKKTADANTLSHKKKHKKSKKQKQKKEVEVKVDPFTVLTGGLFEKSDFDLEEETPEETPEDTIPEEYKEQAKCDKVEYKGTATTLDLPGSSMRLTNVEFLLCSKGGETPTFNNSFILINNGDLEITEGNGRVKYTKKDITIVKMPEEDEYQIAPFTPLQDVADWLKLGFAIFEIVTGGTKFPLGTEIADTVGKIEAKGSFNSEQSEMIITLQGENPITTAIHGKAVHLIRTYEKGAQPKTSILASFDAVQNFADLIGQATLFDENKWLKGIEGSSCVFAVESPTSYLSHTKASLSDCFGTQETDGEKKTFETLETGIHGYLKVSFKNVLKTCWEDDTDDGTRTDKPPNFDELKTAIKVYGKIAKDSTGKWQFAMNFLDELPMPVTLFMTCFKGIKRNMPSWLSDKQVVLKHLSKNGENIFQIEFDITRINKESKWYIPATSIELEHLYFSANNNPKKDEGDTEEEEEENKEVVITDQNQQPGDWVFDAAVSLKLYGSDLSVKGHYEKTKKQLEISSTKLRIGDILNTFNAFKIDDDSVFHGMGVNNFNLDLTFESSDNGDGNDFDVKIRGTPVFANFESLHLAGVFRKTKEVNTTGFAVGLYLNGADFTPIMQTIFKRTDISMAWLKDLQVVVIFNMFHSNVTVRDADKKYEEESKRRMIINAKSVKAKSGRQRRNIMTKEKGIGKQQNISHVANRLQNRQNVGVGNGEYNGDGGDDTNGGSNGETPDGAAAADNPQLLFHDMANFSSVDNTEKPRGIHLEIFWKLPTEKETCDDAVMCLWIVDNLVKGSATTPSASISASFSGDEFSFAASFNGSYPIKTNLTFEGIQLKFYAGIGKGIELELAATLKYKNTDIASGDGVLTLTGAIKATPTSLMLEFSMGGTVKISDFVGLGNVKLGGGISLGMPSFMFGATIKIGPQSGEIEDKSLVFRGEFRVDLGDPTKNYIYAHIDTLTIERVCDVFELEKTGIPQRILDTGFPKGLTLSYAKNEVEQVGGGTIPAGVSIEGTFNILGFEPYAKLNADESGFELHFCLSPINWAFGMIQLYKRVSNEGDGTGDENEGAEGRILMKAGKFEFEIVAFGRFLMLIEIKADIKIKEDSIYFDVSGPIIPGILQADIRFQSQLADGDDNGNPLFHISVTVYTQQLQKKIINMIKLVIGAVRVLVRALLDGITLLVNKATNILEKITVAFNDWKKKLKEWENQLEQRARKLEEEKEDVNYSECVEVCLPFLDWNSKCWKVWGHWVGCPFWNSCFTKIRDPICVMRVAFNALTDTVKRWANQAVLALKRLILAGAQGLLKLAEKVKDLAESAVKSVKEFRDNIEKELPEILKADDKTFDNLREQFALRNVTLWATLSAGYKACVGYYFNVAWFGETYDGTGEACLDVMMFAKQIMNAIMNGHNKTKNALQGSEVVNEAEKEKGEHEASVEEAESEGAKTNETVKADVELLDETKATARDYIPKLKMLAERFEKYPRHSVAPAKREMEIIKLSEQKHERYDVKGDPHVRSIVDESPWKLPNHQHTVGHNETVRRDDDAKEKRTLHFDSQLTSCGRIKRALDGYSELTDGLLQYTNAVEKTSQDMEQTKMKNNENLGKFRRHVEEAVSLHNMSGADAADAYYLYHKLADRHDELEKRSIIAVQREDAYAMPLIRRNINDLLSRETGSTFMKYTEEMHHNAVQGYKRSNIPTPNDVQGEQILKDIKMELQSIVTNENSKLTSMRPRLVAAKRNIITMSEITKKCRQN